MKAETPTVYTSVSHLRHTRKGIIRMSLHPIIDDVPCGGQNDDGVRWPFRVAWRDAVHDVNGLRWSVSCRGVDAGRDPDCIYFIAPDGMRYGWSHSRPENGEDVDAVAIAWLLAGERKRKATP